MLYEHPDVLAITENLFGPDQILTYFASDTPFPGSDYQKMHIDCRLPFPEAPYGVPTYSVVLNMALVDFTEENGPLELWPGATHMIAQPKDMERLATMMPSVRLLPKAGDFLLRDARCWHRGTPSHGARSRPNLALVYSRGWFRFEGTPYRMRIPRAIYHGFPEKYQIHLPLLRDPGTRWPHFGCGLTYLPRPSSWQRGVGEAPRQTPPWEGGVGEVVRV